MSFTKGPVILTMFIGLLSGALGQSGYSVTYSSTSICGLKGSFVDILCTYTYPSKLQIKEAFWFVKWETGTKATDDLSLKSKYQGRVEYLGNYMNNCTLQLQDLKESDTEEKYIFRFLTDHSSGKYSGSPVFLTLTDLQVLMDPPTVKMRGKVTLTCNTTCSLSNSPTYIWYRNSQPVSDSHTSSSNTLIITSVSNKDTGSYSCAVRGHEDHPSPSVCVSNWSVTSTPKSICALKGSSVELHSYYTYPCNHTVTKAYWYITWVDGTKDPEDLKEDEHYQGRVTYTGNVKNAHTLSIRNLHVGDTKQYAFRFLTDQTGGKWTGQKVELSVTDLLVQMDPATVKEGGKVTLSCSTTCSLSNNPTYIWYRNSQPVENLHPADNSLVIDSARPEDAGKYSCAIKRHEALSSPEKYLNITYAPRNTSVALPPGDIIEGSSVTLTCSTDANPPVINYTWYTNKHVSESRQRIGDDMSYTITNISSEHSGLYYCEAENKHGARNSSATLLDVYYSPRNISVSRSHSGELQEGDSVTLTCSSDANPAVHSYTWYKKTGDKTVRHSSGRTFHLAHLIAGVDDFYHCEAQNRAGSRNSTEFRIYIPGFGLYRGILFSALGAILAVVLLLLVIVCWRRQMSSSTKTSQSTDNNAQGTSDPVYDMASDSPQRVNTNKDDNDDDDDVKYASVQFKPKKKQQEVPGLEEASVQYAAIQCKPRKQREETSWEDEVQYANIHRKPKKQGEEINLEVEVEYASIHRKPKKQREETNSDHMWKYM